MLEYRSDDIDDAARVYGEPTIDEVSDCGSNQSCGLVILILKILTKPRIADYNSLEKKF